MTVINSKRSGAEDEGKPPVDSFKNTQFSLPTSSCHRSALQNLFNKVFIFMVKNKNDHAIVQQFGKGMSDAFSDTSLSQSICRPCLSLGSFEPQWIIYTLLFKSLRSVGFLNVFLKVLTMLRLFNQNTAK